ncbi:MAG: reverse transcriptase-like protein, partial [Pseudomonadota bacterium]
SFCYQTNAAGWAAWIRIDGLGKPIKKSGELDGCDSAEDAEMRAALNGLFLARSKGATDILLQSDCMAVVGVIAGKKSKWRKARKRWGPLKSKAFPTGFGVDVDARHVKGHTKTADARSFVNRWCDREAKSHMRKMRGAA